MLVLAQPAVVPVIVYVVVTVGFAMTDALVVEFNTLTGLHENFWAPRAFIGVELPLHIVPDVT